MLQSYPRPIHTPRRAAPPQRAPEFGVFFLKTDHPAKSRGFSKHASCFSFQCKNPFKHKLSWGNTPSPRFPKNTIQGPDFPGASEVSGDRPPLETISRQLKITRQAKNKKQQKQICPTPNRFRSTCLVQTGAPGDLPSSGKAALTKLLKTLLQNNTRQAKNYPE